MTDMVPCAPHPKHVLTASRKLLDATNLAVPTLSTHKHAIEVKRADNTTKRQAAAASLSVASGPLIPTLMTSSPSPALVTDVPEIPQTGSDSDLESQQPHKCFNAHSTFYTEY